MFNISTSFIFFSAGFALILSMGQLIKPLNIKNYILSGFLFSLSMGMFYMGIIDSGLIQVHPHFLFSFFPFPFLLGPLGYMYVSLLSNENFTLQKNNYIHFLPFFASIFIGYQYWSMPLSTKIEVIQILLYSGVFTQHHFIILIPMLSVSIYLIYVIFDLNPLIKMKNKRVQFLLGLVILWVIAVSSSIYSIAMGNSKNFKIVGIACGLSVIYLYFISQREPDFLLTFGSEVNRKRYERSLLTKINIKEFEKRLNILINNQTCLDPELTLSKMAKLLNISSHQLSEYLNEHKNMNFHTFINQNRIAYAQNELLKNKDKTILSIAFDCGFNSLSSFNAAFQKETGLSPSLYRKNSIGPLLHIT
ncbi:MAG: helix-turn-helix domain-containing protein [Spirochaetia bacterium]|nr:helix-turn-helix domain-containing protein [Spirochaetia bacterium]